MKTLFVAAVTAAILPLMLLVGCAARKPSVVTAPAILYPPAISATHTKSSTLKPAIIQPVPMVARLEWKPNYMAMVPAPFNAEVTVIERCTDLVKQDWQTVFIGATNCCVIPLQFKTEFYRAGNQWTNI